MDHMQCTDLPFASLIAGMLTFKPGMLLGLNTFKLCSSVSLSAEHNDFSYSFFHLIKKVVITRGGKTVERKLLIYTPCQ